MEALKLEVKSEAQTGRTQIGDIVAIYEQHSLAHSHKMDFLRVSFLKKKMVEVLLSTGGTDNEQQEIAMNADIEYRSESFHCRIKEQEDVPLLWDIFWQIYNQLKSVE